LRLEGLAAELATRYPSVATSAATAASAGSQILELASGYAPSYLASGLIGVVLLASADALAESATFQYSLAALGGLLLAVLWVAWVLSTTANTLLSRAVPAYQKFVTPLLHFVFGNTAYYFFFSSQWLLRLVLDGVYSFWHDGALGLPWAGKAFFLSSMLVSMAVTRFMGLFRPKSTSEAMLQWAVRLLGATLLFNSTSNGEISSAFVLVGLFQEHLLYWQYRLQIEVIARSAPTNYTPRVSANDFEETKRRTTERELRKLQAFLNKNPERTDRYADTLSAGGRRDQARYLYRFARGELNVGLGGAGDSWGGGAGGAGGGGGGEGYSSWWRPLGTGGASTSPSPHRRGAAYDDGDGDDEDYDDDAYGGDVVDLTRDDDDDRMPPTHTPSRERLRESMLRHKSPSSQRRAIRSHSSWGFRVLFPAVLLLGLAVAVSLFVLHFQTRAYTQLWTELRAKLRQSTGL